MTVLFDKHRLIVSPGLAPTQLRERDKFDSPQHADAALTIGLDQQHAGCRAAGDRAPVHASAEAAAGDIRIISTASRCRRSLDRSRRSGASTGNTPTSPISTACKLDGLIVTGAEPNAATLPEEPFWRELTDIDRLGEDQHALDDLVVPCRPCRGAASRRHRAAAARCKMFRGLRLRQGDRRLADAGMSPRRSRFRIRASTSCAPTIWPRAAISC